MNITLNNKVIFGTLINKFGSLGSVDEIVVSEYLNTLCNLTKFAETRREYSRDRKFPLNLEHISTQSQLFRIRVVTSRIRYTCCTDFFVDYLYDPQFVMDNYGRDVEDLMLESELSGDLRLYTMGFVKQRTKNPVDFTKFVPAVHVPNMLYSMRLRVEKACAKQV